MFKPEILLETDKFIAINKPAGLLSIPDREGKEPSLKSWLREKYGNIFTVHRLDRDTSGVIVFAKDEETHKMLSEAFEKRDVTKIYQGLVQGSLEQSKGTIDLPIMEHPTRPGAMVVNRHGKASVTDYEVVEDLGLYSLIQFQIHTGRTHQIRV
ncbi:MAG TPA: RNA pseudouridine synthase, partial [Puia sp.]